MMTTIKQTDTVHAALRCIISKGSIVWDVEEFLNFNVPGKPYPSPEFHAGDTRWRLNLFSAGEEEHLPPGEDNNVGLYIHSLNDKCIMCKYTVILYTGDQKIEQISDCDEFVKNDNWGWGQLCPLNVLKTILDDNHTLRIQCDIEVFVKRLNVIKDEKPIVIHPSTQVCAHYQKLLDNAPFHDVEFMCGDVKICAHKCVLATRSLVFQKMFSSGMKESTENKVIIQETDAHSFKLLLRFIYTGTIDNESLQANTQELMALSDKYDVEDLKALCDTTLLDQLTPQSACHILLLADAYHSVRLKEAVLNFAASNFTTVLVSPAFAEMCRINPPLVAELNLLQARIMQESISKSALKRKRQDF
eukprot:TRINITY_DN10212_c0_g1_i1.p1 TRINITY_DN10212_c0_g1~~TRINITY_DN10212_c0_g1_i1.p1  ORF type:complete len:360 (-),score=81.50 TRINITY_DN10212_c0_g1_i1:89-1168(-)